MEKNKVLKMKSLQKEGNESNATELTTQCSFEFDEESGSFVITYDESSATGFEGSKTKLVFKGNDYASIERSGSFNSGLLLELGKKHFCHYGTPYGSFTVGINALDIRNGLSKNEGGSAYVRYTVDLNSSYISENEITFDIS